MNRVDEIKMTIGEDGKVSLYVDTYDITIHCESQEEQEEVERILQNVPHWIPCSAGLPKTNDPVNVTWVNRNPEVYYMDIKDKPFTATAHYYKGRWYWYSSVTQDFLDEYGECESELVDKDFHILAWMPLPGPYKEVTT